MYTTAWKDPINLNHLSFMKKDVEESHPVQCIISKTSLVQFSGQPWRPTASVEAKASLENWLFLLELCIVVFVVDDDDHDDDVVVGYLDISSDFADQVAPSQNGKRRSFSMHQQKSTKWTIHVPYYPCVA